MRATKFLLALLSMLFLTTAAHAQWITFTDETSSRLFLTPFADDPKGDPIDDGMEKDIAVGDLNLDGRPDAIVVRKLPFSSAGARQDVLLIHKPNGELRDETEQFAPEFLTSLTDAHDVIIRDFTGDGCLDVVICNTFEDQPRFYKNLGFFGDANGDCEFNNSDIACFVLALTDPTAYQAMFPDVEADVVLDMNGDGVFNNLDVTGFVVGLTGGTSSSWRGLKDESATRFPTIEVPQDVSTVQFCAVWAGDIDGQNGLDLYFSNYDGSATKDVLFINDGTGHFTNQTDARLGNLANVAFGTSNEIHDVDNDGDNDIVKISTLYETSPFNNLDVFIIYNDGNGFFSEFQSMGSPDPYMFTMGDLDNNGWLDMYIVEDSQDKVALAQGVDGNGEVIYNTNTISNSPRTEEFGGNIKFKDIDGDGDLDLGVAPIDVDIQNCGDENNLGFCLLRNDGSGGLTDPYAGTTQNFNLSAHDYDYIDLNGDGRLDLILCLCDGWRVLIQDAPEK